MTETPSTTDVPPNPDMHPDPQITTQVPQTPEISYEDSLTALGYLRNNGVIFPYNRNPGSRPGQISLPFTNQEIWDSYQWNPPQFLDYDDDGPDPDASPKPTWEEIRSAVAGSIFRATKSTRIQRVSIEETRRICEQYLEGQLRSDQSPTVQLEILYRLRAPNPELTLRDAERDRLHDVATTLLIALNAATTIDNLIDPADDDLWLDD